MTSSDAVADGVAVGMLDGLSAGSAAVVVALRNEIVKIESSKNFLLIL